MPLGDSCINQYMHSSTPAPYQNSFFRNALVLQANRTALVYRSPEINSAVHLHIYNEAPLYFCHFMKDSSSTWMMSVGLSLWKYTGFLGDFWGIPTNPGKPGKWKSIFCVMMDRYGKHTVFSISCASFHCGSLLQEALGVWTEVTRTVQQLTVGTQCQPRHYE